MSGKIKVAVFHDNSLSASTLQDYFEMYNFEVVCFNKAKNFLPLNEGGKIEVDVALIHSGFSIGKISARVIIQKFLKEDTRRVVVSGHSVKEIKRDLITELGADHYFDFWPTDYFLETFKSGKISEEEKKLRGFSVGVEGGARVKAEMGLAPDGDLYDDGKYMRKAKEGY